MITLNLYICENCPFNETCSEEGRERIRLADGQDVIATCKCQKEDQYDWFGNKVAIDNTEVQVLVPTFEIESFVWVKRVRLSTFLEDIGFKKVKVQHTGFSDVFVNGIHLRGHYTWRTNAV